MRERLSKPAPQMRERNAMPSASKRRNNSPVAGRFSEQISYFNSKCGGDL